MPSSSRLAFTSGLVVAAAWLAIDAREARACGGCMHPPPGPTEVDGTVVTDHRMVFAISPAQSVLWDQIRYSGSPTDFAWVLPVKPGTVLQLSHDEWMAALDANTQTVIQGPSASCYSSAPTEYDGPGPGGCGFGGASSDSASPSAGFADADASAGAGNTQVQVVSEQVVGPYDAVTVHSSQGEALGTWLRANGYAVPASIQPTIDAFASSGFDFIALRLAPGEGVQAMQPVRVVTQGADPQLPLRMVAAGAGATVGIELWVLSEGRYHPQNFPDANVDFSQLAWDPEAQRSNYTELATQALAANGGRGWLTEFAGPANLYAYGQYNPALATTYESTCAPIDLPAPPGCGATAEAGAPQAGGEGGTAAVDGGTPAVDGGAAPAEAGTGVAEAGASGEAGSDEGGSVGSGSCQPTTVACDDLDVALGGITEGDLWITRLRANLPQAALAADLVLEAAPYQTPVASVHVTTTYTIPDYNPCAGVNGAAGSGSSGNGGGGCACRTGDAPHAHYADAILAALAAVAVAGMVRRRRRATQ